MLRLPAWLRLVLIAAIVAAVAYVALNREAFDAGGIEAWLRGLGWLEVAAYVAVHVLASLAFVPRTIMGIVAGLLFGATWGIVWGMVGAMAGSVTGFLVARHVNAGLVEIETWPRLGPWLRRAEAGGWRSVLAARLVPFFPHSLVNYALGLTRLPLGAYFLGSFLGFLPVQVVCARLGASGLTAMTGGAPWLEPTLWGVAFLALTVVLPRLLRRRENP